MADSRVTFCRPFLRMACRSERQIRAGTGGQASTYSVWGWLGGQDSGQDQFFGPVTSVGGSGVVPISMTESRAACINSTCSCCLPRATVMARKSAEARASWSRRKNGHGPRRGLMVTGQRAAARVGSPEASGAINHLQVPRVLKLLHTNQKLLHTKADTRLRRLRQKRGHQEGIVRTGRDQRGDVLANCQSQGSLALLPRAGSKGGVEMVGCGAPPNARGRLQRVL